MKQAASNWLVKSYVEAANKPPETMNVPDFIELFRQNRVAFYQKRGDHMANLSYLLMQTGKQPADPAAYLATVFAVAHHDMADAEYTVSLVGAPMQKIVIVKDLG